MMPTQVLRHKGMPWASEDVLLGDYIDGAKMEMERLVKVMAIFKQTASTINVSVPFTEDDKNLFQFRDASRLRSHIPHGLRACI